MLLQGCSTAPAKADKPPVRCQHPTLSISTNADIARAVEAYKASVQLCNKLNGFK